MWILLLPSPVEPFDAPILKRLYACLHFVIASLASSLRIGGASGHFFRLCLRRGRLSFLRLEITTYAKAAATVAPRNMACFRDICTYWDNLHVLCWEWQYSEQYPPTTCHVCLLPAMLGSYASIFLLNFCPSLPNNYPMILVFFYVCGL